MIWAGWFLTGLVAVAWVVRVIVYAPATGDVGVIFITFCAALVVIAIWIAILIASAIETGARLRREMRDEQSTERLDA